jgi:hypothetical protein
VLLLRVRTGGERYGVEKEVDVLSRPQLITTEGRPATFQVGQETPVVVREKTIQKAIKRGDDPRNLTIESTKRKHVIVLQSGNSGQFTVYGDFDESQGKYPKTSDTVRVDAKLEVRSLDGTNQKEKAVQRGESVRVVQTVTLGTWNEIELGSAGEDDTTHVVRFAVTKAGTPAPADSQAPAEAKARTKSEPSTSFRLFRAPSR